MTSTGPWRFFHDEYGELMGERTPPIAAEFRAPFRDLLMELGASLVWLAAFLDAWRRFRAATDPAERYNGNNLA
ncbi:MAG: hypothetical protein WAM30_07360, partial [Candidatus Dormiibacterota bacterium]